LCSCHRDGKAKHTDACRRAHRRWDHSAKRYQHDINKKTKAFEKKTGAKI
jgi:hypothetical protein